MEENNVLVDVRDLAVYFHIEQGIVKAVDGVNFKIEKGKSLGAVSYTHLTLPTTPYV